MKKSRPVTAILALLILTMTAPAHASGRLTILTSLPAVSSITSELTADTSIDVVAACPPDCRMGAQKKWLTKNEAEFARLAKKAELLDRRGRGQPEDHPRGRTHTGGHPQVDAR